MLRLKSFHEAKLTCCFAFSERFLGKVLCLLRNQIRFNIGTKSPFCTIILAHDLWFLVPTVIPLFGHAIGSITRYLFSFHSGCTGCNCNSIGSLNSVCNTSTAFCPCKPNVEGLSCDQCKAGFYGYSSLYPGACLACQCSGKTSQCKTASGFRISVINTTLSTFENSVALDGWTAVNENGFRSGNITLDWNPLYSMFR